MTFGIHHITTINSDPQKTYDFYAQILGLRFIKKTVNFDAPSIYHLYFGNEAGEPGTAFTVFPIQSSGTGMRGAGQVTKIQFSVPMESLGFWLERFIQKGVRHEKIEKQFGNSILRFYDFDGLQLELVAHKSNSKIKPWTELIEEKYAIRSFFGIEASVDSAKETERVITKYFGYEKLDDAIEGKLVRYVNKNADHAQYFDIFELKDWPKAIEGAGTVHHVAFRLPDLEKEQRLRTIIESDTKLSPTEVIDRDYFKSVYFREPNNILFELATDDPGFSIDESLNSLGTSLRLPKRYEPMRKDILSFLKPIVTGQESEEIEENTADDDAPELDQFVYVHVPKDSEKTIILLHGTGDDEYGLIPLADKIMPNASILSVRGNIQENGMNRFFRRFSEGNFDLENMDEETEKLSKFIKAAMEKYKFTSKNTTILGFSNGANIAINLLWKYPKLISKAALLHPMIPYEPQGLELKGQRIIITSGEKDHFLRSDDEMEKLEKYFIDGGAKVKSFQHKGGHEVTREEVEWLQNNIKF